MYKCVCILCAFYLINYGLFRWGEIFASEMFSR